eukprot:PhM_4_TR10434/c0_g1_i1/m.20004
MQALSPAGTPQGDFASFDELDDDRLAAAGPTTPATTTDHLLTEDVDEETPSSVPMKEWARMFRELSTFLLPRSLNDTAVLALIVLQFAMSIFYAWAYNSYAVLTGDFAGAIETKDRNAFRSAMIGMVACVLLGTVVNALILLVGDVLTKHIWMDRISVHYLKRYMAPMVSYNVLHTTKDADQRLSHDVMQLCHKLRIILFGTPMYVGATSVCCCTVWFTISLWQRGGYFCPTVSFLTFFVFTIINRFLMNPAATAREAEKKLEAEYVFAHSYFRMHSEDIAFLNGSGIEEQRLEGILRTLVHNARMVEFRTFPLNASSNLFYWGVSVVAYIIPGASWWLGSDGNNNIDVDDFVALSTLVSSLMTNMSTLLLLSEELSSLLVLIHRLDQFSRALERVETGGSGGGGGGGDLTEEGTELASFVITNTPERVAFRDVSFCTPDRSLNIRSLTFTVNIGGTTNLLITGPSGCGKSSLLRVLGGLWEAKSGDISKPSCTGAGITYMPQRPYLTIGSLKDQISYPGPGDALTDREVRRLLETVQLAYLLERDPALLRRDNVLWCEVLSGGEQQRLGLARVLHQRPAFAVLDECTSALDEDVERHIYEVLRARQISLISVAHRSTVRRYHDQELRLGRDGSHCLLSIDDDKTIGV